MFTKKIDKPCCTITCKINIKIMTAGCGFGCYLVLRKSRKNRLAYALLMPPEVVVARGEAFEMPLYKLYTFDCSERKREYLIEH